MKRREPELWQRVEGQEDAMTGIARICRNCEHFDGGGLDKNGEPREEHGDCHNSISGRYTTTASEGCEKGFYPCTTRWPLRAGEGGVR